MDVGGDLGEAGHAGLLSARDVLGAERDEVVAARDLSLRRDDEAVTAARIVK